jgi:hypothetical protein
MLRLKHFLVFAVIFATSTVFAGLSHRESMKGNTVTGEIDNLRIFCLPKKAKEMTSMELYAEIKKAKKPFSNGDTSMYKFDNKPYLYTFAFDIQHGSENRYIVKVESDELDSKDKIIPMTTKPTTRYVNPIKKHGEDYKAYHPVTRKNITQDEYNKINTMTLTYLCCWLIEADHWGIKD